MQYKYDTNLLRINNIEIMETGTKATKSTKNTKKPNSTVAASSNATQIGK